MKMLGKGVEFHIKMVTHLDVLENTEKSQEFRDACQILGNISLKRFDKKSQSQGDLTKLVKGRYS